MVVLEKLAGISATTGTSPHLGVGVSKWKTDQVLEDLRSRVAAGRFPSGSVLVEPALADEYGVSRTPVREALRQLVSEGVITVLPKKGYLVRAIGLHELEEAITLRLLLEPHAARTAASYRDDAAVIELRELLDRQTALMGEDRTGALRESRSFHRAIARASRFRRMEAVLEHSFNDMTRAHFEIGPIPGYAGSEHEIEEHERIFSAIAAGDPDAAEAAMLDHVRAVRATTLRHLAGSRPSLPSAD